MTTNLASGNWTNVISLNWTNTATTPQQIGDEVASPHDSADAFYFLQ